MSLRDRVRRVPLVPPPGAVRWGDLRRTEPISTRFGFDRGQPIDRYYIEAFLERHADCIRGRTLEVGDDAYTRRFGGDRVLHRDVLHVSEGNPQATFVADLAHADHIPADAFDCIILTQTLHLIFDVHAAIATLYRVLRPGGVLLATFPGISQISSDEWSSTWYWAFTPLSVRQLFGAAFGPANIVVESSGNVLAATSFLHGLAAAELHAAELASHDPAYPVTIAVAAVKAASNAPAELPACMDRTATPNPVAAASIDPVRDGGPRRLLRPFARVAAWLRHAARPQSAPAERAAGWRQALVSRERQIRAQRSLLDEMERGRLWLEEQVENWKRIAAEREQLLHEQKAWTDELERSRTWLEDQRGHWQRAARELEHAVAARDERIAELIASQSNSGGAGGGTAAET